MIQGDSDFNPADFASVGQTTSSTTIRKITTSGHSQSFTSQHSALSSLDSKEDFVKQLQSMGYTDITQTDVNDEALLENVSRLQESTSSRIDSLMNTVKKANETLTGHEEFDNQRSFTRISQTSTVTKTILDAEGNVVEQVTTTYNKDPSSSESDTSPTLEDVVYKEYPHLSKHYGDQSNIQELTKQFTTQQFYHSTNIPFENITSLRAHFVQPLYSDMEEFSSEQLKSKVNVSDDRNNNSDSGVDGNWNGAARQAQEKDEFKGSPKHFPSNLAFQIGKFEDDIESGLELLSSNATLTPKMRDTFESGIPESIGTDRTLDCQSLDYIHDLELDSPVVKSKVQEWMSPVISGDCLNGKEFWKDEKPTTSDNSTLPTEDQRQNAVMHSKSTDHSPRSPTSITKSLSPTGSVHSLPASPLRKISASVRKMTSESFSSDHDISKSLEIVYVEPDVDPKEEFSAQYRNSSPSSDKKFEKRKPSYTQLKRPVSHETRADSPSGNTPESGISLNLFICRI